MGSDSEFSDLEREFFRQGDELANETYDDFSDLDDKPSESSKSLAGIVVDHLARAAALTSLARR